MIFMIHETVHKLFMNTYFILSIVSILAAIFVISIKVCFASKCEEFTLCYGLFQVKRNVSMEEKEFHGGLKEQIQEIRQTHIEIDKV